MRKKILYCLLVAFFALLIPGSAWGQAPAQSNAPIRLQAATFVPGRGEAPAIPPGLTIAGYAESQRGYYLVQFRGPVEEQWRSDAAALGVELLEYVPDYAFKARMTPAQARELAKLAEVNWIGLYHPAYKLSARITRGGQRLYRVRLEQGSNYDNALGEITSAVGAAPIRHERGMAVVLADSARLDALARVLDVAWIEDFTLHKKFNEYAAGVIMGANTANANGYNGSSQTMAIADTGLGGGTTATAHRDLPASRFHSISNWPGDSSPGCYSVVNDGAVDVDTGHGTHTTLSAVGGGGPGGEGRGTAPAAKIFFQSIENYVQFESICSLFYLDGYYLIGIPLDISDLFSEGYASASRVHSNSWGSDSAGAYTTDSMSADNFMWTQKSMLVLFAAGNAGTDTDLDGVVDLGSIGSPATAKNVLSVGASENDRQGNYPCDTGLSYTSCATQGGQNVLFGYNAFGFDANPLASDPSAGNAEQMAAFSSRGPTTDGRIKPDVVAPGTWVLSGYSNLYQEGYDSGVNPQNGLFQYDGWGFPRDAYYKYLGGTSMSTPLTAGGAAVVRDFYSKARGVNPSAALVKATLIHTAVDLLDENNNGVNDNANPIPNNHEGWGRVDLAAATSGQQTFTDNTTGLGTGGTAVSTFGVAGGAAFKVTLVWTDYPSTESATVTLVNDLDLTVTSPTSTIYRGNVFSGGWSQTGGAADRRNNVENVYVQSAAAGTWTVEVRGFNVPNGPQPFALVVSGAGAPPPPNVPPVASFTFSCTGLSCNFDGSGSSDSDGTIVSYVWNFGDSAAGSGVNASHTYAADGTYVVTLTVTDNGGATGTQSQNVSVSGPTSNQPPTASFTFSCTNLACNFNGAGSSDSDGTIVSYAWNFGDGSNGTGVSTSHTYAAGGTYLVTLTVTDNGGATGTQSQNVTVAAPPPPTAHAGDLDGSSATIKRNIWAATVTITVHDENHNLLANASVTGTWTGGASGTGTCTTNSLGKCAVSTGNISNKKPSTTFSVNNITAAGRTYQAAANHDPDGDSDGTSITVTRP